MRNRMWLPLLCLLALLSVSAAAEEAPAQNISGTKTVAASEGFADLSELFDEQKSYGSATSGNASLTLRHDAGIGSVYLLFDRIYGEYTVTNTATGAVYTAGSSGFFHECVDLQAAFGEAPQEVRIDFASGSVKLCELEIYTAGKLPESVQQWQPPLEGKADLVLFSTHGDDEQLFFAGLLPYYAGEKGYNVQVVYLTDHREDEPYRIHEMLNGLWAVGVKAYPVAGAHPDFIRNDLEETYQGFVKRGYSREYLLGYVVENLRRFKPMVAVGHDVNGEYGHGMHMVYTDLLMKALPLAADDAYYSESADRYGTWDTPKTYLHLYKENPIVMDWDVPLESFGGMTAFQVTQKKGFPSHASQFTAFEWYLVHEESAKDITWLSPCEFGLYRSTVGADEEKNDMFEHVQTHAEVAQQREEAHRLALEKAEQARLEAERLAEEARIAEEQRLEAERLQREAEERRRAEEAARLAEEQRLAEQARRTRQRILFGCGATALVAALLTFLLLRRKRKAYRGRWERK